MSNSDAMAGGDAPRKPQDPAAPHAADDLDTGAEELRAMLRKLGDQIAATDRRNSETLAEMQAHLSQIGGKVDVAKSSQASEPGDAADEPAVTAPAGSRHDEDVDGPLFGHSGPSDEDRFAHPVPEAAPQQPMFISSSSPQPWALRSAVGLASGPDALTPFAAGEPWDREAADALSRIYESGEATRSSRMDYRMSPPPRRVSEPLPGAVESASSQAEGGVDRPWLEERFADIALRIEQSMADMRSGPAVRDLTPKFDQLEQRIIAALDLLATRVDVDGLKHVEAHVNELFTHVEHATAQLARLDSIELQLNALGDRLGDDRIARLAAELMPTEAELTALAEAAADRAVARLTSTQAVAAGPSDAGETDPAGGDRVASIEDLLRSSIEERRRNEEQTAAILDTLQQAMQYMIDRVQMIEQVAMQAPESADGSSETAMPRQPVMIEEPAPVHADGAVPAAFADERAGEPVPMDAPPSAAGDRGEVDRALSQGADWSMLPTRPEDLTPPTADEPPRGGQGAAPQDVPALASEAPVPMSRDDFVAAARRAARKASGQPTRDLPAAPTPPPVRPSIKGAARLWTDASARIGSRRAMLTAASVVAALLVGGAVMYASSFRPVAIFAKSERRALPVETEAPGKEGKGASLTPIVPAASPERSTATLAPTMEASAAAATPPSPSASNPASLGITLQTGPTAMTPEQLAEIRRQQQLAALSQQLARKQAEETAKAGAALPTVLTAAAASAPAPDAPPAKAETPAASPLPKLPMPPAAIGPNSLRLAAANGDASAQFEVAARFAEGRGIKQDFKQAMAWYQRSAAQSFVPAQYRLATLYERGLGGEADPARALLWYKRAAEGGYVKAMHNLAAMSANRTDTAPDYATAARWFASAAERGLADSQYNLGILAESGLGMDRDLVAAYKWFSLAARQGDKDAVKRRDALKAHLSLEQLRTADQEIATWKAEAVDARINDDRMAGEAWKGRTADAG